MKITKKVKCNLCKDIITLENNDKFSKCKCGKIEIKLDKYGDLYTKNDIFHGEIESLSYYKIYEREDYLIPNEEIASLISKLKYLSKESSKNDNYINMPYHEYIDENEDGSKFLNELEIYFTIPENKSTNEDNEFKLELSFYKDDLFEYDEEIINSYTTRLKNYLKLYNYFNDLKLNGKKFPSREEIESKFENLINETEYDQLKYYDVNYYI